METLLKPIVIQSLLRRSQKKLEGRLSRGNVQIGPVSMVVNKGHNLRKTTGHWVGLGDRPFTAKALRTENAMRNL